MDCFYFKFSDTFSPDLEKETEVFPSCVRLQRNKMLKTAARTSSLRPLICVLLSPLKRESDKHEKIKPASISPFPLNSCKGAAVPNSYSKRKTIPIFVIFVFQMNS